MILVIGNLLVNTRDDLVDKLSARALASLAQSKSNSEVIAKRLRKYGWSDMWIYTESARNLGIYRWFHTVDIPDKRVPETIVSISNVHVDAERHEHLLLACSVQVHLLWPRIIAA